MVKRVPSRFNPDAMARDGTLYETDIVLSQFTRLQALVVDPGGNVHATFRFSRRKDHIVVSGRLRAELTLECQRCLEPMVQPLDEPFEFVFADSESEARRLPDALDPVVLDESGQVHVVDLFEDELLLCLPAVPLHQTAEHCGALAADVEAATAPAEDKQVQTASPFGVLKDLKLH